jgi:hypothetical protein
MSIARRVVIRAKVLTDRWVQRNAFVLGLTAGGMLTTLVLLIH